VLGSGSQGVARGAAGSVAVGGARPERAEWCVRRRHWRRSAPTRVEGGRVFEKGVVSRTKEGGTTLAGRGRLDEREGESVRSGGDATARES
jgi:hypothetical protein